MHLSIEYVKISFSRFLPRLLKPPPINIYTFPSFAKAFPQVHTNTTPSEVVLLQIKQALFQDSSPSHCPSQSEAAGPQGILLPLVD